MKRQEELLGNLHPSTLRTKSTYTIVLYDLKRIEEAEKLGLEVVKGQEEVLGPNNYFTFETKTIYLLSLMM